MVFYKHEILMDPDDINMSLYAHYYQVIFNKIQHTYLNSHRVAILWRGHVTYQNKVRRNSLKTLIMKLYAANIIHFFDKYFLY